MKRKPDLVVPTRDVTTYLTAEDHATLKRVATTHGIAAHLLFQTALLQYLDYLENGQWAVALPLDLIQPAIDAARAAGSSVPRWIEACLRQAMQRPLDIPQTIMGPRGRPRTRQYHVENPTIFCRCGCGQTLLQYDRVGRARQYILGHWMPAFMRKRKQMVHEVKAEGS